MADPSATVNPALLSHVHLLSTFKYPYAPAPLHSETVLEYLSKAPAIVREHAPVAWTYLTAPNDGSVLLVWRGGRMLGSPACASDGYIWAEPELRFVNELHGYTIEIHVHESGFVPSEPIATHRRVRYRLTASPPGAPHDPALEIMHYSQSSPEHRLSARTIPMRPDVQNKLKERLFLERAGGLPRKDFMLGDAGNWPTIVMPGTGSAMGMTPGFPGHPYQQQMQPQQQQQQHQQQQQQQQQQRQTIPNLQRAASSFARPSTLPGPSPSKRARQLPPARMSSSTSVALASTSGAEAFENAIADEEAAPLGDALDMLTPQEISATRYAQHHEWMDAVLGSVYGVGQIEMVPLNLEAGMLDLVSTLLDNVGDVEIDGKPDMVALAARLNESLESSSATITALNAAHEAQLARHKNGAGAVYARLERELAAISPGSISSREKMNKVVEEMGRNTGMSIGPREEIRCVRKGGLQQSEAEQKMEDVEMDFGFDLQLPTIMANTTQAVSPAMGAKPSGAGTLTSQQPTTQLQQHGRQEISGGQHPQQTSTSANRNITNTPTTSIGVSPANQTAYTTQPHNTASQMQSQPRAAPTHLQSQNQTYQNQTYQTSNAQLLGPGAGLNMLAPPRRPSQSQHQHDIHSSTSYPLNTDTNTNNDMAIDDDAFGEFTNHGNSDDDEGAQNVEGNEDVVPASNHSHVGMQGFAHQSQSVRQPPLSHLGSAAAAFGGLGNSPGMLNRAEEGAMMGMSGDGGGAALDNDGDGSGDMMLDSAGEALDFYEEMDGA